MNDSQEAFEDFMYKYSQLSKKGQEYFIGSVCGYLYGTGRKNIVNKVYEAAVVYEYTHSLASVDDE